MQSLQKIRDRSGLGTETGSVDHQVDFGTGLFAGIQYFYFKRLKEMSRRFQDDYFWEQKAFRLCRLVEVGRELGDAGGLDTDFVPQKCH